MLPERCVRSVRLVGEVQPLPLATVMIGGWGIWMRARTARWAARCTAAGSVALIGAGLVLSFADRHLVPASLTVLPLPRPARSGSRSRHRTSLASRQMES
jgi:hypothetical protein